MNDAQFNLPEELYVRGLAHYRAGEWRAASDMFTQLQALSNAYPEVESLLADAKLKIEIERTEAPEGVLPPKYRTFLRPRFITAVPALVLLGLLLVALRPTVAQSPIGAAVPTPAISLPTPAPTSTPIPADTPTAAPTTPPEPGQLVVRLAADAPPTTAIDNIELILDSSGSMGAFIGNQRRIDIAHDALSNLINQLPTTTNVALRAYGHRRGADCSDIELVVPLGPLDRTNMVARINAINPVQLGQTPTGAALRLVAGDIKGAQGAVHIILVSDGEETCRTDPVAVAQQLRANTPQLTIDVIGFSVNGTTSARLAAIAQAGGGRYFDAADAQQLTSALHQAALTEYIVRDDAGQEVYRGAIGTSTTLPAGRYSVEVNGAQPLTVSGVTVEGAHPATVELRQHNGTMVGVIVP